MLRRKVVVGDQAAPVVRQPLHRFGKTCPIPLGEDRPQPLGLRRRRGIGEAAQRDPDLALLFQRHRVEDVHDPMIPAARCSALSGIGREPGDRACTERGTVTQEAAAPG